jgi:hypothetical protein
MGLVAIQLDEPAELVLRLLARRDVAAHPWTPTGRPFSSISRRRHLEHEVAPALRDERLLVRRGALVPRELLLEVEGRQLLSFVGEVVRELGADQLVARVPEEPRERCVHGGQVPVEVDGRDRLVGVLEQVAIPLLVHPAELQQPGIRIREPLRAAACAHRSVERDREREQHEADDDGGSGVSEHPCAFGLVEHREHARADTPNGPEHGDRAHGRPASLRGRGDAEFVPAHVPQFRAGAAGRCPPGVAGQPGRVTSSTTVKSTSASIGFVRKARAPS